MNNIGDYLQRKAENMDLSRGDDILAIQRHLDGLYAGQARATSLNNGQLRIATPNAVLASELRMGQVVLMQQLAALLDREMVVTKIIIQIKTIAG